MSWSVLIVSELQAQQPGLGLDGHHLLITGSMASESGSNKFFGGLDVFQVTPLFLPFRHFFCLFSSLFDPFDPVRLFLAFFVYFRLLFPPFSSFFFVRFRFLPYPAVFCLPTVDQLIYVLD